MPSLELLTIDFRACSTSEEGVRIVREIACTKSPEALPILASFLGASGPIAEAVVDALVSFGREALFVLRQCLAREDDPASRRHAALALARLGDAEAAKILAIEYLAWARGRLGTARFLVEECGELGVKAILEHAVYDIHGENAYETEVAVTAIAARGTALEEILVRYLQADRNDSVELAMHALALIANERVRPGFEQMYAQAEKSDHYRCLALVALTRIEGRKMQEELCRVLADGTEANDLRAQAAMLLREVGDSRALPVLRAAAEHRDWWIAGAAEGALTRIEGGEAGVWALKGGMRVVGRPDVGRLMEALRG